MTQVLFRVSEPYCIFPPTFYFFLTHFLTFLHLFLILTSLCSYSFYHYSVPLPPVFLFFLPELFVLLYFLIVFDSSGLLVSFPNSSLICSYFLFILLFHVFYLVFYLYFWFSFLSFTLSCIIFFTFLTFCAVVFSLHSFSFTFSYSAAFSCPPSASWVG